jgi:hypothetical protein
MCYAQELHLRWNDLTVMSACGVQQKYPLGPLLFCLVIQLVRTAVTKQAVVELPNSTLEGVYRLFVFYMKNGFVVTKHIVLLHLGGVFTQEHASTVQVLVDCLGSSVPRRLLTLAHASGAPSAWPSRRLGGRLRRRLIYCRGAKPLGSRFT